MTDHPLQHAIVSEIFLQIAKEKNKPLERIKHLILIKQHPDMNRRFWEILDCLLPDHGYEYVGCCGECGHFDLK